MVTNCTGSFEAATLVAGISSSSAISNNSNGLCSGTLGSDVVRKKMAPKQLFANSLNSDAQVIDTSLKTTLKIMRTSKAKPRLNADLLFERLRHFYRSEVACFAAYMLNDIRIDQSNEFVTSAKEHFQTPRQMVENHNTTAPSSPKLHSLRRIFFRPSNPLSIVVSTLHTSRHDAISASDLYINRLPVGRAAKVNLANDHDVSVDAMTTTSALNVAATHAANAHSGDLPHLFLICRRHHNEV